MGGTLLRWAGFFSRENFVSKSDYVSRVGTVVPGFSVLGFRVLCTGNQIWIYVINLPGFSALPGFKAPFHGDGQSALNPRTTVPDTDGLQKVYEH